MSHLRAYKIEVCVVSYHQALAAADYGADRLELCSRLETEGMTPDVDLAEKILDKVNIPVRIMIRETEMGFESSERILDEMKSAIGRFEALPIDGFVIGLLKNNRIDRDAIKQLVEVCSPWPVTIHKAIDQSQNVMEDILWLNEFSTVDTILTSGGKTTAVEGVAEILKMKSVFKGDVMGAGKITNDQLPLLHQQLQLKWYHGRNIL
jgi:copper homeostasis protein